MRPTRSARSEKRSSVESQNAPNSDCNCSSCATFPSMKSKILATTMITPARTKRPRASAHAASTLITTPTNVSTFGWMRSLTQAPMIARSGNMQIAPIAPVNVTRGVTWGGRAPRALTPSGLATWTAEAPWGLSPVRPLGALRTGELIMEGSDTERNRDIVAYAHPRTQGSDWPPARAAGGLSVLQRGGADHLRGQGPRPPGPRPQLPGRLRQRPEDRRASGRSGPSGVHRHRLGGRGARPREQPDQAAHAE